MNCKEKYQYNEQNDYSNFPKYQTMMHTQDPITKSSQNRKDIWRNNPENYINNSVYNFEYQDDNHHLSLIIEFYHCF